MPVLSPHLSGSSASTLPASYRSTYSSSSLDHRPYYSSNSAFVPRYSSYSERYSDSESRRSYSRSSSILDDGISTRSYHHHHHHMECRSTSGNNDTTSSSSARRDTIRENSILDVRSSSRDSSRDRTITSSSAITNGGGSGGNSASESVADFRNKYSPSNYVPKVLRNRGDATTAAAMTTTTMARSRTLGDIGLPPTTNTTRIIASAGTSSSTTNNNTSQPHNLTSNNESDIPTTTTTTTTTRTLSVSEICRRFDRLSQERELSPSSTSGSNSSNSKQPSPESTVISKSEKSEVGSSRANKVDKTAVSNGKVDRITAVKSDKATAVRADRTTAVKVDRTTADKVDRTTADKVDRTTAVRGDRATAVKSDRITAVKVDKADVKLDRNAVKVDRAEVNSDRSAVKVDKTITDRTSLKIDKSAVKLDRSDAKTERTSVKTDRTTNNSDQNRSAVKVVDRTAVNSDRTAVNTDQNRSAVKVVVNTDRTTANTDQIRSAVKPDKAAVKIDRCISTTAKHIRANSGDVSLTATVTLTNGNNNNTSPHTNGCTNTKRPSPPPAAATNNTSGCGELDNGSSTSSSSSDGEDETDSCEVISNASSQQQQQQQKQQQQYNNHTSNFASYIPSKEKELLLQQQQGGSKIAGGVTTSVISNGTAAVTTKTGVINDESELMDNRSRYPSHRSTNEVSTTPRNATPSTRTNNHHDDRNNSVAVTTTAAATTPSLNSANYSTARTAGLNGLKNIGNTCFMNSVLQCLSNTRPLLEYMRKDTYTGDINTTISGMKGALVKAFASLIKELWSDDAVVNTAALKTQIQRFAPRFMGYSQQDAQEFLRYLLEGLHEDVNRVSAKPTPLTQDIDDRLGDSEKAAESWHRYTRMDNSKVVDLFVGQLKSTLRCTHCGHCSVTFDPFWDLSLPIPPAPQRGSQLRLVQCLESFTREETLDGDEKPTCARCRERRKCTKSFAVQRFPKILVIHLKRFSPMERFRGKLSVTVDFPLEGLDMSNYAADAKSHCRYNLYAISNHSGTTYSGHYTAYCKHPYSNAWHEYNDSRVSTISARSIVSGEAYVLFYELEGQQRAHL